jgi:cytochrome c
MNSVRKIHTASLTIGGVVLGFLALTSPAGAATSDAAATQLLTKYNCQACHTVDKKVVGPAYKEVAAKYAGDSTAPAKLEQKVKNGGSGVWGAIPMPPNNVPDADLKTLVEWILALK